MSKGKDRQKIYDEKENSSVSVNKDKQNEQKIGLNSILKWGFGFTDVENVQ